MLKNDDIKFHSGGRGLSLRLIWFVLLVKTFHFLVGQEDKTILEVK